MTERGPHTPEIVPALSSFERAVQRITAFKTQVLETQQTLEELLKHGEIKEGSEAAFRAALNVVISIADTLPGAGEIASWGADLLKIVEEIRYRKRKKEAIKNGEDPALVKREKYNLTPDVSVYVATLTESLEFLSFFTAPTHAIETTIQLWYDVPRMRKGIRKAREVLADMQEKREEARKAALFIERGRPSPNSEEDSDSPTSNADDHNPNV